MEDRQTLLDTSLALSSVFLEFNDKRHAGGRHHQSVYYQCVCVCVLAVREGRGGGGQYSTAGVINISDYTLSRIKANYVSECSTDEAS